MYITQDINFVYQISAFRHKLIDTKRHLYIYTSTLASYFTSKP